MDLNRWVGIGKVDGTPAISSNGGKKQSFFNFTVTRRTQQANGQWVNAPMTVPVYSYDTKADVVEKYVEDGQELALECHIMTWDNNGQLGFGMIIDNVSLGFKPRKDTQQTGGGATSYGPPV